MTAGWVVLIAPVTVLAALTAVGARRRGAGVGLSLLEALAFPVAWVVWFARDNHAAGRSAFQGASRSVARGGPIGARADEWPFRNRVGRYNSPLGS